MQNRFPVALLPSTCLIALLLTAGCTGGSRESPPSTSRPPRPLVSPPGTLRIHLPVSVRSANPLTFVFSHERWITQYTHASLYILNKESMEVEPELATALPERVDEWTWKVRLRQDARWHDGEPLTAVDVAKSFEALQNPEVNAERQRDAFSLLKSVEALDRYTLELKYSRPHAFALLSLVDFPVVPAHVLGTLTPAQLNDAWTLLGSGPFKVAEHGDELVDLERNDDWFGEAPKLDSIEWVTITDANAAGVALRRGEIDAMGVPYVQWRRDLGTIDEVLAGFYQVRYHRPAYRFFGWNCSRPLLEDKNVRRALAYAFDVDKYLRDNYYSGSRRVTGPFFFKSAQYNQDVKPLPCDPGKAVELLRNAGWKDSDGDGILDRNGERFEFKVTFSQTLGEGETRAVALQEACKALGIRVELERLDNAALTVALNEGEFDCVVFGLGTPDPEIDPYQLFHSSSIGNGGSNYYRFSHQEADRLMEEARQEFDRDKRNALYHRLHEIIYDEQPLLFLFAPEFLFLVNKRFQGVKSYSLGLTPRIGIEWWTEK